MGIVLTPGHGGWAQIEGDDHRAFVRFRERGGGRLVVSEVRVAAERVTGDLLRRALPLGRIEAMANTGGERTRWLRQAIAQSGEAADQAGEQWEEAVAVSPGDKDTATFRAPFHSDPREVARRSAVVKALRAGKYPERKRPDEFYRAVVEVHDRLRTTTRGAAGAMADAAGVPRSTVYRWLKEARRRAR